MTQEELNKLQQASKLIQAKNYKKALVILKTMPKNPKAQEWIIKINEKMNFDDKPRPTANPTPPSDTGDMPIKPAPYKKRFNWRKWALVTVFVLVVVGIGGYLVYDDAMYKMGLNNLEEAKVILTNHCHVLWGTKYSDTGYSEDECRQYAEIYLNANVRQAWDIVVCDLVGKWDTCPVKRPNEVIGY